MKMKALSVVIHHWIQEENKIRRTNREEMISAHLELRGMIVRFWALLDLKYMVDMVDGDSSPIELELIRMAIALNNRIMGINDDHTIILLEFNENNINLYYSQYDMRVVVIAAQN